MNQKEFIRQFLMCVNAGLLRSRLWTANDKWGAIKCAAMLAIAAVALIVSSAAVKALSARLGSAPVHFTIMHDDIAQLLHIPGHFITEGYTAKTVNISILSLSVEIDLIKSNIVPFVDANDDKYGDSYGNPRAFIFLRRMSRSGTVRNIFNSTLTRREFSNEIYSSDEWQIRGKDSPIESLQDIYKLKDTFILYNDKTESIIYAVCDPKLFVYPDISKCRAHFEMEDGYSVQASVPVIQLVNLDVVSKMISELINSFKRE